MVLDQQKCFWPQKKGLKKGKVSSKSAVGYFFLTQVAKV